MSYVNLVPETVVLRRVRRRRIGVWSAVVVVVLGGISAAGVAVRHGTVRQRSALADYRELHEQMQLQIGRTTALQSEQEKLAARERIINRLLAGENWPRTLVIVSHQVNDHVWLERLEIAPVDRHAAPVLTGVRSAGGPGTGAPARSHVAGGAPEAGAGAYRLTMTGFVTTNGELSALLSRLMQVGAFRSVDLRLSKREPFLDGSAIRFEVACVPERS